MNDSRLAKGLAVLPALFVTSAAHAQVPSTPAPPPSPAEQAPPAPVPSAPAAAAPGSVEPARGNGNDTLPGGPAPVVSPVSPSLEWPPAPGGLTLVVGQWRTRIYGFAELDIVRDSTQAFPDLGGWVNTAIPKSYNYAGSRDNLTVTARNSRFGVLVNAPELYSIRPTLTLEGDFMGNQPSGVSESAFITSPTFRLRVAAMLLESDCVNVLAGQGWELFGFQPFFFPATDFLMPIPGAVLKRDLQVQLTHTFRTSPVNLEMGASVNRPPQAASGVPDVQVAARMFVNGWRGVHTPGVEGQRIVGSTLDSLAIAVSGAGRRFRVGDFEPTPAGASPDPRSSSSATGYALAADAYIPVIRVTSLADRRNGLTLTGEVTKGTGYADLLGGLVSNGGGPASPAASYPMIPGSPDPYVPNIQSGLVTYDNTGNLHTIDWTTFLFGAQYYLPFASGRVFVSANYAEAHSANVANWADPGQLPFIFTKTQYCDGNLFWDISASVRAVLSGQYYQQTFADGETAHNVRTELSTYFWF